ncbi:MAG: tripartite tricarboxylate transporter substrate binding protein [Burkholderiaceae bacterium]
MMKRRNLLAALPALALPGAGRAQAYPNKPLTMIVGFPPGGAADITARLLAKGMSELLGQSIVVDNKPGASGVIGAEAMLARPADGYTLLLASNSITTARWLYPNITLDPARDFRAVGMALQSPYMAVVNEKFAGRNIADLVRAAKERPGRIDYATAGAGTGPHLFAELFKEKTGTFMTGIPYKGSAPALTAVIGGEVPVYFDILMSSQAHLASGKLKSLGVSSKERMPQFPNVPTFAEQGLQGLESAAWFGVVAKAGTPEAVVQALNQALVKVVRSGPFMSRAGELGATAVGGPAEAFQATLAAETAAWGRLIKDKKIRIE